jgi:hypothetical protein
MLVTVSLLLLVSGSMAAPPNQPKTTNPIEFEDCGKMGAKDQLGFGNAQNSAVVVLCCLFCTCADLHPAIYLQTLLYLICAVYVLNTCVVSCTTVHEAIASAYVHT